MFGEERNPVVLWLRRHATLLLVVGSIILIVAPVLIFVFEEQILDFLTKPIADGLIWLVDRLIARF